MMEKEWTIFFALAQQVGSLQAATAFREMGASMKLKDTE